MAQEKTPKPVLRCKRQRLCSSLTKLAKRAFFLFLFLFLFRMSLCFCEYLKRCVWSRSMDMDKGRQRKKKSDTDVLPASNTHPPTFFLFFLFMMPRQKAPRRQRMVRMHFVLHLQSQRRLNLPRCRCSMLMPHVLVKVEVGCLEIPSRVWYKLLTSLH